jgi:hypothetical protein
MNYMQQPPEAAANPINYYAPSPLANPHRRAFSTYAADATQLGTHGGITASMFAADDLAMLGMDDGGEHGDPKRRRIARVRDSSPLVGFWP